MARARGPTSPNERVRQGKKFSPQVPAVAFGPSNRTVLCKASLRVYPSSIIAPEADRRGGDERTTTRRPGGLSAERWAKPNPTSWHHKKSGAEHSIQRHSSSPTGLSGGCAKPIFDHAHEKSAKRQGDRGLMLRPLSSNLPYRSRREELRLRQRRKKSVWVRSIVRGRFLVAHQRQECDSFGEWTTT